MIDKVLRKIINKEIFLYSVFGVLTSVLNVVLFKVLLVVGLKYTIANLITLIVVKLAAYICNKNFVFKSKCPSTWALFLEFIRFIVARGATALIDYFGLIFMVEALELPKVPSKIFITIFVIIINYVIGKRAVFKHTKKLVDEQVELTKDDEKCKDR